MTFPYIPYLILTGLMGIHSITTVEKLSVKSGDSVSIPCLYDSTYINHVKSVCKGYFWRFCTFAVKTNQTDNSGKFSISDDTNQRVFTVTINDLTDDDKHYWCAVVTEKKLLVRQYFQLSVTTDEPEMSVEQQEIAAFEGGSVTVLCRYKYPKVMEWCGLGSTCVKDQTGSMDGATVTFNASVPNVFNVTMSELRTKNSGWYWCTNSDFQMPVHITVHESTSTTTTTMSLNTANFTGTHSTTTQNSPLPTSTTRAGGESVQVEHQRSALFTLLYFI
ncbi:polymeric immunoglobulin receptor-like [Pempheris klunzingeri]|uniref:polymeric immunoglobulin receptor-like n=1 Tax=Pempheris klunzingeri TaxID=3127111 RepID=UPI0039805CA0